MRKKLICYEGRNINTSITNGNKVVFVCGSLCCKSCERVNECNYHCSFRHNCTSYEEEKPKLTPNSLWIRFNDWLYSKITTKK